MERIRARLEQVEAGTPSWPAGTTRLAVDHEIEFAADHGADLVVADREGSILRVPKDGGPVVTLAELRGHGVSQLAAASDHVIAVVFQRKNPGSTHRLVAIPLAGGPMKDIVPSVGVLARIAGTRRGVLMARNDMKAQAQKLEWFEEPSLDKSTTVANVSRYISDIAADERGATWIEDELRTKRVFEWSWGDKAPRLLGEIDIDDLERDGRATYFVTKMYETRPYAEAEGALLGALHGGGAVKPLVTGLSNPHHVAAGGGDFVCVVVHEPKLEHAKNAAVIAVPRDGGPSQKIASGLRYTVCKAADATHFYVTVMGERGIAGVPVSG